MKALLKVYVKLAFENLPLWVKVRLLTVAHRVYLGLPQEIKILWWPQGFVISNWYKDIPVIVNDKVVFLVTGLSHSLFPEMPLGCCSYISYNGKDNAPCIFITRDTFNGKYLNAILAHEYGHIKNGHNEILLTNPELGRNLKWEFEADQNALEEVGPVELNKTLTEIIKGLSKCPKYFKESIQELEIRKIQVQSYYS